MGKYKLEDIELEKEKLIKYMGDYESASKLCDLYYNLTNKGFEVYIATYYEKIHQFDIEITGGYNDGGIDIRGKRTINGEEYNLIIQCKQWHWSTKGRKFILGVNELSKFWGKVENERGENTRFVIVTTKYFIDGAKEFANNKNIRLIENKELVEKIYKEFPVENFKEYILYGQNKYKKNDIFEEKYLNELKEIDNKLIKKEKYIKEKYLKQNIQVKMESNIAKKELKNNIFSKIKLSFKEVVKDFALIIK